MSTYGLAVDWSGDPYGYGDTPGMVASSPAGSEPGSPVAGQLGMAANAGSGVPQGNPVQGFLIFAFLIFAIMAVVHRFGKEQPDFANVKASVYNVAITTLMVAAGMPLLRTGTAALAKTGIPGAAAVNTYVGGAR